MDEFIGFRLDLYCDMVLKGKPSALIALQTRYIAEADIRIKESYALKTFEQPLSEGWTSLWIYKKDYMLEVIKNLPESPKTVFEHWVLGKAFGYSDESIAEFVKPLRN